MSPKQDGTWHVLQTVARYCDKWEYRDGEWVIVERIVTNDFGWHLTSEKLQIPTAVPSTRPIRPTALSPTVLKVVARILFGMLSFSELASMEGPSSCGPSIVLAGG
ncbi:MAG: hypothetical protein ACLUW6_08645 [Coriobacteriaceae bacterium]